MPKVTPGLSWGWISGLPDPKCRTLPNLVLCEPKSIKEIVSGWTKPFSENFRGLSLIISQTA